MSTGKAHRNLVGKSVSETYIRIHTSEDNIKMKFNKYGVRVCIGFIRLSVRSIARTTFLHFIKLFRCL